MSSQVKSPSLKMIGVIAWLIATLGLAGWWLVFGLMQANKISSLKNESVRELVRMQRMLLSEGSVLFVLLLGGGLSLLYYTYVETRRSRQLQAFFAAFTHDLRTSLASLRLQAESLQEEIRDLAPARITARLVKDTVRLELQLENSLFLASSDSAEKFYLEDVSLQQVLMPLRHHWPDLQVEVERDVWVHADQRAFESIIKNLIQNSVVHGKASRVLIRADAHGAGLVRLVFEDNGRGFNGNLERLGRMFERHSTSSGSGIGLHLVVTLVRQLHGHVKFNKGADGGFLVELSLQGRVA